MDQSSAKWKENVNIQIIECPLSVYRVVFVF